MDRGIGGNYGYRWTDFFPMGIKGTGRGIVKGKSKWRDNGRRTGSLTRKSMWKKEIDPYKPFGKRIKKKSQKRKRTSTKKQGSFKKAKKIRTTPSKFAKRHYDDYGSIERDHCAYFGFQRHGSKLRMWSIIGEALAKALLAKIKVYPRAYNEAFDDVTHFNRLQLGFKRVSVPGGAEEEKYDYISFDNQTTFEQFAALISDSLRLNAEKTAESDGVYAYYPLKAMFMNNADDDIHRVIIRDLGEAVLELYASQTITIKNLTPNDDDTTALDVVGVNPIVGKKYEFNNFRPKLIDSIEQENAELGAFYEVNDTSGINTAFTITDPVSGVTDPDHMIAHPPVPRTLFTNCARAANVYMAAGGMKKEVTTFKMKHKLSTFIERIYYNRFDKGSFGGCTFFAFERKARSVTGDSRVKISFDRALHMSAHCQLKVKKTMLKHYENTAIGVIADP
jgi:hypothetical protein